MALLFSPLAFVNKLTLWDKPSPYSQGNHDYLIITFNEALLLVNILININKNVIEYFYAHFSL